MLATQQSKLFLLLSFFLSLSIWKPSVGKLQQNNSASDSVGYLLLFAQHHPSSMSDVVWAMYCTHDLILAAATRP